MDVLDPNTTKVSSTLMSSLKVGDPVVIGEDSLGELITAEVVD